MKDKELREALPALMMTIEQQHIVENIDKARVVVEIHTKIKDHGELVLDEKQPTERYFTSDLGKVIDALTSGKYRT